MKKIIITIAFLLRITEINAGLGEFSASLANKTETGIQLVLRHAIFGIAPTQFIFGVTWHTLDKISPDKVHSAKPIIMPIKVTTGDYAKEATFSELVETLKANPGKTALSCIPVALYLNWYYQRFCTPH